MRITTDCTRRELSVTLGTTVLPVTDYQIKTEAPVRRLTLCDGSAYTKPLGRLPCTLTVSGTVLSADASGIVCALQDALRVHTDFHFSFADMHFDNMKVIAVSCKVQQEEKQAEYTVTMLGVIKA